ncbi:beta-12-xylosyltransferase [Anaeramoeba ignava]|uniref:EGF domain-specific O-linked N-acetylglucosamine transferase n=1 Tax=Anaeramoeba ignava TaxID=1746090 RepID=A0A9Q0LTQ8_ANAIG|nr:beta-12-xylosyltransferase [Anaeramoeba ignava]
MNRNLNKKENLPLIIKIIVIIVLIGQITIFFILNSKWIIKKENEKIISKEIQIINTKSENENGKCEIKYEICKNNSLTTSIIKMMEMEKEIEITKKCSDQYGFSLINNWKKSRINICSGIGSSQISCYKRFQPEKHILCTGNNVEIKGYDPFFKAGSTSLPAKNNVHFGEGFLTVDCNQEIKNWIPSDQWEMHMDYVIGNMVSVPEMNCEHWINETAMFIFRWDYRNSYHALEDYITTFISLMILDEDPQKIQLVFTDDMPSGSQLYNFWSIYFGKEPIFLRDGKFPKNTCFKKVIFGMWARYSILDIDLKINWNKNCRSPILFAFKNYIFERFNISFKDNVHKPPYTIAFVKREDYIEKKVSRKIPNYDEIFNYIEGKLPPNWSIIKFQPEKLTIEEQIQISSRLSIIMGPHGAAFSYLVYFPEKSHLIEIFMENRVAANVHFRNICTFMGHEYHNAGHFNSDIPPDKLWNLLVHQLMKLKNFLNLKKKQF